MENLPKVSIIVVTYNNKRFIEGCLQSLMSTDYPNFEVIVVENASTDGSTELIRKLAKSYSHIKIIRNQENLGHAEGSNIGAKMANCKYIAFVDSDTSFDAYWLKEAVKTMEKDPIVGAVQSKLRFMHNPKRVENIGGILNYYGVEVNPPQGFSEESLRDYVEPKEVFYAKSAAMIVKKKAFEEAGKFDPNYFVYFDDADLCWRIRLRGYSILFVGSSIVYHEGGGTMRGRLSLLGTFHMCKNHIMTLLKNYQSINLLKYLMPYLTFVLLHAIYKALKKDYGITGAYLKAILWNLRNIKYIYLQRLKVQRSRRISDVEIKKLMSLPSIPWQYL